MTDGIQLSRHFSLREMVCSGTAMPESTGSTTRSGVCIAKALDNGVKMSYLCNVFRKRP